MKININQKVKNSKALGIEDKIGSTQIKQFTINHLERFNQIGIIIDLLKSRINALYSKIVIFEKYLKKYKSNII